MSATAGEDRARARPGPWLWHLAFWPALIATAWLTLAGTQRLARVFDVDDLYWLGERADTFMDALDRAERARMQGLGPVVLYFGDSTVSSYEPGRALPQLTRVRLRRTHGYDRLYLESLAGPGSGIDHYAYFADRIAKARPDVVIWQLAFFHFTDRWMDANGAPELVGYVAAERLPEILALPYERLRLSLSDIVLQQGIVRLGFHDAHRKLRKNQLRFARLREPLEEALNPNRGRSPESRARSLRGRQSMLAHVDQTLRNRYSALGERGHFESTLEGLDPDDLRLHLLRSGIATLRRQGIQVLVYMNPTNLDHLRRLGMYDEAGIARTLEVVRSEVERAGGHFLDLHALLADEDFKDPPGHFVVDAESTVPLRIVTQVAAAVDEILRGRAPSTHGPDGTAGAQGREAGP